MRAVQALSGSVATVRRPALWGGAAEEGRGGLPAP